MGKPRSRQPPINLAGSDLYLLIQFKFGPFLPILLNRLRQCKKRKRLELRNAQTDIERRILRQFTIIPRERNISPTALNIQVPLSHKFKVRPTVNQFEFPKLHFIFRETIKTSTS